ncbi:group 3 secretory phospholipase A2-like [Sinocyclocheilus anshuiensis]|uniref:group 3 secretory phospholipase A2-like n=1 Tax=Sinocyclocheilus anshuiensis TaxID=1608454 RepID=UPI0007B7EEED|nr:PREDICTED: group 3 secretory phospholipase A2-like [Sinocyclocheilus anshuiensis]
MQSNHLLQAVLYLFMLFHACFSADNSEKSSTFCSWTRSTSGGQTQYAFLRRTQTSLLLYDSIWNKNNSLFTCITSDEQSVIDSYLSRCWEDSSFSKMLDARFDISELIDPHGPCEAAGITEEFTASVRRARDLRSVGPDGFVHQDSGESSMQTLHRSKRAWMIPGTLWCGSGNKAMAFADLVLLDMALPPEFSAPILTSESAPESSPSSPLVPSSSPSSPESPSFPDSPELASPAPPERPPLQNLVGFLIGRCAIYELAQYAVVKDAANYTDTLPDQVMEMLETSFHQTITLGQNQVTKNTDESLTIQASKSGSEEPSPVSTSPGPSVTTLLSRKSEASVLPTEAPNITTDRPQKGKFEMCELYRHLDSCHLQIPALQQKFGLRNSGMRTLYHCNCTARLVQKILSKELDETDPVHSLLMDFVSQSCFTLSQSENCINGKSCSSHPPETQLIQNWGKDMTGGRHLVDFKRKLKRMNPKRSKRKDSQVILYKKCIRMHTKLQKPRVPKRKRS